MLDKSDHEIHVSQNMNNDCTFFIMYKKKECRKACACCLTLFEIVNIIALNQEIQFWCIILSVVFITYYALCIYNMLFFQKKRQKNYTERIWFLKNRRNKSKFNFSLQPIVIRVIIIIYICKRFTIAVMYEDDVLSYFAAM